MRYRSIAAIAMLALLAAGGSNVRAEDADHGDAFAKRLFAGKVSPAKKSFACFVRHYGAAHLAQHPRQTVTAMKLLVSAEKAPEDQALNYTFALGIKFRDREGNFDSSGDCGHPMASQESADKLQLGCGVDCDGGGLSIELVDTDKSALVRIERLAIWNSAKPDEDRDGFEAGADDRVFRLDRVKLDECKPLMGDDSDEKPATM